MSGTDTSTLAFTHWRRSTWLGFLYLIPCVLIGMPAYLLWENNGQFVGHMPLGTQILSAIVIVGGAYALGGLFWSAVFLGIPAALVGLLRVWPMGWLFGYFIHQEDAPDMWGFLFGTFLIFEAPVILLIFFISDSAPVYTIGKGAFCQLVSLPWLFASLRVAYKMMLAQASPAT